MEPFQNTPSKRQRNQRKQRDKKKTTQETVTEELTNPSKSVKGNEEHDPQPQRANPRQRNESHKGTAQTASPVVHEEKENVVVDHSNLKRETEEIEKLKTKFTKRVVTSNWHRYSAPEEPSNSGDTAETTPANFFDLLQVPVSKGGHFQLKDEQDWSSSGSELGGYFALDVKLLSQSLACIPICDQLRLPKHWFTEEEIRKFDAVAEFAKSYYNPNEVEDPNSTNFKKPFNILDIDHSNKMLLNIDINELEIHDINHTEETITNLTKTVNFRPREDIKVVENKNETLINEIELTNCDDTLKKENIDIEKEKLVLPTIKDNNPEIQVLPIVTNNTSNENIRNFNTNIFEESISCSKAVIDISSNEFTEPVEQNKFKVGELYVNKMDYTESKENSPKINDNKLLVEEVNKNKTDYRVKDLRLEDDDDLDFLLSLKTPVLTEAKEELKPVSLKDSSFLPEGPVLPQSTTQDQQSELDDWLDSLLED